MLTQECLKSKLHYDPDTGLFTWIVRKAGIRFGSIAGTPHSEGYVQINVDCHIYLAHRLAWLYMTGEWPKIEVDHEDTNRSNNRWANLRPANSNQNKHNRAKSKNNKSGIKGVSWSKSNKKWQAQIMIKYEAIHLGFYNDISEAAKAYAEASVRHHRDFSRIS